MNDKIKKLFSMMFGHSKKASNPEYLKKLSNQNMKATSFGSQYPHMNTFEKNWKYYINTKILPSIEKNVTRQNFPNTRKPIVKPTVKPKDTSKQLKLDLKRRGGAGPNGIL